MKDDMTTWTVGNDAGNDLPNWVRTTIVTGGEVFVPAAIGDDETGTCLRAASDGETVLAFRGHPFVRLIWLALEFRHRPDIVDLLDLIERQVSEAMRKGQDRPRCAPAAAEGAEQHG